MATENFFLSSWAYFFPCFIYTYIYIWHYQYHSPTDMSALRTISSNGVLKRVLLLFGNSVEHTFCFQKTNNTRFLKAINKQKNKTLIKYKPEIHFSKPLSNEHHLGEEDPKNTSQNHYRMNIIWEKKTLTRVAQHHTTSE